MADTWHAIVVNMFRFPSYMCLWVALCGDALLLFTLACSAALACRQSLLVKIIVFSATSPVFLLVYCWNVLARPPAVLF